MLLAEVGISVLIICKFSNKWTCTRKKEVEGLSCGFEVFKKARKEKLAQRNVKVRFIAKKGATRTNGKATRSPWRDKGKRTKWAVSFSLIWLRQLNVRFGSRLNFTFLTKIWLGVWALRHSIFTFLFVRQVNIKKQLAHSCRFYGLRTWIFALRAFFNVNARQLAVNDRQCFLCGL